MGLPRTQRIARSDHDASVGLELTPEDYFVLSRIEGAPTVDEVISASGLPKERVEEILENLVAQGAIALAQAHANRSEPPSNGTQETTASQWRRKARARRRSTLEAMLTTRRADTPVPEANDAARTPAPASRDESRSASRAASSGQPSKPSDAEPKTIVPGIEPANERDPRLDPNSAIPIDDQRWLLGLADRVDELDEFSFLGIVPTDDIKVIRRAYHERSRRLHPDTYYGRQLGFFGELLTALFSHAKQSYQALQDPEVRRRTLARQAALTRLHELEQQRERAAEVEAREQAEAERRADDDRRRTRGKQREQQRLVRQRSALQTKLAAEARNHAIEAERAYAAGHLAKAANFYRLALRSTPDDDELRRRWEHVRDEARRSRASDAYERGMHLLEHGQPHEAAMLLSDAADAAPTLEHLARAADALRHTDPERARDLALSALDALQRELAQSEPSSAASVSVNTPSSNGRPRSPTQIAAYHLMIGRAFLAAGQNESAKQQALAAAALNPDDPGVHALVKAVKVT